MLLERTFGYSSALLATRAHFWLLDEFGESDAQGRAEQAEQAERDLKI